MLNLLLIPVALYLLVASVCITTRMTRRTQFRKRPLVWFAGFLAVWTLARAIQWAWVFTPFNVALAGLVLVAAWVMWKHPRLAV